MAIDFRLQGKDNAGYWTLFPKTNVQAIVNDETDKYYKKVNLRVNIPIPTGNNNIQTINIVTDNKMPNSYFEVYLASTGEQANNDYATIDQIEVETNRMIITRLGDMPKGAIDVDLVFYEKGRD